jgi:tetratricopeptide (TPR) repeat protein
LIFFSLFFLDSSVNCFCQSMEDHKNRATEKTQLHDYPGAIEEFTIVIEMDPHNSFSYFDRGIIKGFMKDYVGEIADYTRAIGLDTANADYFYLRAIAKGNLKNYSAAVADYTKALELEPGNADALNFCPEGFQKRNSRL